MVSKQKKQDLEDAFTSVIKKKDNIKVSFPEKPNLVKAAYDPDYKLPIEREDELKELSKYITDQNWDDLKSLSDTIKGGITSHAKSISEAVEFLNYIQDETKYKQYQKTIHSSLIDLDRFLSDFEIIEKEHAGLTGAIKDENENMKMLMIFDKYNSFYQYFQGSIFHSAIELTELALDVKDLSKQGELDVKPV